MCGGLPLVVAIVLDEWLHGHLFLHLLCALFCVKARDIWGNFYLSLFWIHLPYGLPVFPVNRYHWFLCLLLVCHKDLFRRKSGLVIGQRKKDFIGIVL